MDVFEGFWEKKSFLDSNLKIRNGLTADVKGERPYIYIYIYMKLKTI